MMLGRKVPALTAAVLAFTLAMPIATAQAATTVKAKSGNTTLATAQAITLDPHLVIKQKHGNSTLATAQPVSPTHYAVDVLGGLNKKQTSAFFSTPVAANDTLNLYVSAKQPTKQFPELLLYDPNGNLVAIANGNGSNGSDSLITFTVPNGDGGNWTAEVTGSPSNPDPKSRIFSYDLAMNTDAMPYITDVFGKTKGGTVGGYYQVAANVNDSLHFSAATTKAKAGFPELWLYDPNGNLVAIANGNGGPTSSVIDFIVPGGDSGNWTIEVTGTPSITDPSKNSFRYDLTITGATAPGPVIPK